MYCIIQEINLKRADTFGAYKGLEVSTNPFNYMRTILQYGYFECGERFERPIKKAYKISIHESKRINGVVTKKQFVVTTVNYYIFATDFFCLGEYHKKIADIAYKLNAGTNTIYDLIENKVAPLEKHIRDEFIQTEEYAVTQARKALVAEYKIRKAEFAAKHKIDDSEYDYCFDVFGNLLNAEHYERIINGESLQYTFRQLQHSQPEENMPQLQIKQAQQYLIQGVC